MPRLKALLPIALALAPVVGGCAHAGSAKGATRIAFADLDGPDRAALAQQLGKGPSVIHFAAGERVPLALLLDSQLAHLEGAEEATLVFDRDVYLLLRTDGPPRISQDGRDFRSPQGGHFQLGFRVLKDEPAHMLLGLGVRPLRDAGGSHE